ncbi:ser thr protein phosphatase family protein [Stylonychia lemnae]|uniref:Ser thr protein phosphatase family protein n=1 Tax=Stylonychia lemnae TaxID=5949 RepID=A0A078BBB8_STYLE|nr:ser thr protein phosphatase family protein [Stylonychia lemnae]|eukprot:CDW90552.1 ser thr protein phosphatase family protein [Stylonychia lemnae]
MSAGQQLKAIDVNENMKYHFGKHFSKIKNQARKVFSPILEGVQENNDTKISSELQFFVNCYTCQTTLDNIFDAAQEPLNRQLIIAGISNLCKNKYSSTVCIEMTNLFMTLIFDNIFEISLERDFVCSYLFPVCDRDENKHKEYKVLKLDEYIDRILADKPELIQNDDYIENLYKYIEENEPNPPTYKIMHMSDWHVDFRYQEGAKRNCRDEICCQAEHGFPTEEKEKARKYGEFTCDIPYVTAEKQMELLSQMVDEKIDMIVWTGDQIGHDLHNVTPLEIIETIDTLSKLIKIYFPETPVIPTVGNHDFYPPNYQAFNATFTDHLHQISEIWRMFLSDNDAIQKFTEYGYYKTDMPKSITDITGQKASILGMNSQTCYMYNYGLFNETNDAAKQLAWLEEILAQAEKDNELIIIAAHMSPGDYNCITQWSNRYQALVERYQHIIRFSMYGHDHRELYDVVRAFKSKKPIHVEQAAGALGTYNLVNPSVRIYTMHAKYHIPIEQKTYEFNLDEANSGNFRFRLLTDMKKDFGLKNLGPAEYSRLSERFLEDADISQQYSKQVILISQQQYRHTWKNGVESLKYCDKECRKSMYCESYDANNNWKVSCADLDFSYVRYTEYSFGKLLNPWVERKNKDQKQ